MDQKRKILAILPQQALWNKLEPLFRRSSLEVSRSANATGSLILATNVSYDVIVAQYPLPDLSIVDFLGILQAPTLPNANSPVLLLAGDDHIEAVTKHVEKDERIRVVPQSAPAEQLQRIVTQSLSHVAVRKDGRLMVELEAEVDIGRLKRLCQTSNVSESGMLIHTSRLVPIDSEFPVTFHLPGDPRPIDAHVKVVRHTDPKREMVTGMGVRFTKLGNGGVERLRDYVSGRMLVPEEQVPIAAERPSIRP